MTDLKKTAFHAIHVQLGAKMVPFGGYDMPVLYSGILEEHRAVRSGVGVFDVSHMGEFEVSGTDAFSFLQRVTINDVSRLSEGKVQYSAMCTEGGGIIDDLLVYHCGGKYLLVVNASNTAKDLAWLRSQASGNVVIDDKSDRFSLLAVQGPKSIGTLQPLTDVQLSTLPYYHFHRGKIAGQNAIISRTGYTGETGFELYFEDLGEHAGEVWQALFASGKPFDILPVGLGARDTLRLEMGFCLYGQDIDETTTPLQAGLGWITKLGKGDFVGSAVLVKEHADGVSRKLVGMTLPDKAIARSGYEIGKRGEIIGRVTSGSFSPSLRSSIALGYVPTAESSPDTVVDVLIRGKSIPATIVGLPFLKLTT